MLGIGAALTFARAVPIDVGKMAMLIGGFTPLTTGMVLVEELRESRYGRAEFWLRVWQTRIGDWIVRVAGWRLRRPSAPATEPPEFEWDGRRSLRDLVNLVPALQHLVAVRINLIRTCLNPEMHAGERARPPLDRRLRTRLELCREELDLVWRRLRRVQLKDTRERLEQEYAELERACRAADAVLEAVGQLG